MDQGGDGFDVAGLGEHIQGLEGGELVGLAQEGAVSGLGGRIATDIDDARGRKRQETVAGVGIEAGAGGIDDDAVGVGEMLPQILRAV